MTGLLLTALAAVLFVLANLCARVLDPTFHSTGFPLDRLEEHRPARGELYVKPGGLVALDRHGGVKTWRPAEMLRAAPIGRKLEVAASSTCGLRATDYAHTATGAGDLVLHFADGSARMFLLVPSWTRGLLHCRPDVALAWLERNAANHELDLDAAILEQAA